MEGSLFESCVGGQTVNDKVERGNQGSLCLVCFTASRIQLNIQIICHTISFLQQKSSTPEGQHWLTCCSGGVPDRSGSKHVSSFDEVKARNAGEESAYDKAECFFVLQMPVSRLLMFEHLHPF